jgi:hypothetical protein
MIFVLFSLTLSHINGIIIGVRLSNRNARKDIVINVRSKTRIAEKDTVTAVFFTSPGYSCDDESHQFNTNRKYSTMGLEISRNSFMPPRYTSFVETGKDNKPVEIKRPVKSSDFWTAEVRAKIEAQEATISKLPTWETVALSMAREIENGKQAKRLDGENLTPSFTEPSSSNGNDALKVSGHNQENDALKTQMGGSLENPLEFILAGKAIFTVENEKTGNRFTFRVDAHKEKDGLHFVNVLTGRDNERNYEYIGTIHNCRGYFPGKKSRIPVSAQSQKVFIWLWSSLKKGKLPSEVKIFHEGRCGRCGRKLTVPESIRTGLGPECSKKGGNAA